MTRIDFAALLGILLVGVLLLVSSGDSQATAAGPHIDMFFRSAAEGDLSSPEKFCTGSRVPPVHNSDRAIDVFGDKDSTPCLGDRTSFSMLTGWGIGGSSYHHTLSAWAFGQSSSSGCDIITIGMIDIGGGLHGSLRYIHTNRTVPSTFAMKLYARPASGGGAETNYVIGYTQDDSVMCHWHGYHVHQGTLLSCMLVNTALQATTLYTISNLYTWIHWLDYAEGLHGCDG